LTSEDDVAWAVELKVSNNNNSDNRGQFGKGSYQRSVTKRKIE
jgi:hypothetical protein